MSSLACESPCSVWKEAIARPERHPPCRISYLKESSYSPCTNMFNIPIKYPPKYQVWGATDPTKHINLNYSFKKKVGSLSIPNRKVFVYLKTVSTRLHKKRWKGCWTAQWFRSLGCSSIPPLCVFDWDWTHHESFQRCASKIRIVVRFEPLRLKTTNLASWVITAYQPFGVFF